MVQAKMFLVALVLTMPSLAFAQAEDAPFTGPYIGADAGVAEHHFSLEETDLSTGQTKVQSHRAWGPGGSVFGGYDVAISPNVRIGAELGLVAGGDNPVARPNSGGRFSMYPQWGYRVTGRLGYVASETLMGYASFGYGGNHYRIENTAGVTGAHRWNSSFTVGGGAEYRLSPRIGIRADFRHLDNASNNFMLGAAIRL